MPLYRLHGGEHNRTRTECAGLCGFVAFHDASAGGAVGNAGEAWRRAEVEERVAAMALKPFEHLAFDELRSDIGTERLLHRGRIMGANGQELRLAQRHADRDAAYFSFASQMKFG